MKHILITCVLFLCLLNSCSFQEQNEVEYASANEQDNHTNASTEKATVDDMKKDEPYENILTDEEDSAILQSEIDDLISLNRENIIGFWHDSPALGAGFGDCYYFYNDDTFRFNFSDGDGEKRIVSLFGLWMLDEEKLKLSVTEKEIIEGGVLVIASPSMSSEYEIEGGTYLIIQLNEPETYEYLLSEITIDDETLENPDTGVGRKTIHIGDIQYWKFNDTAEEYYNEIER